MSKAYAGDKRQKNLTEGNVSKQLLLFSIPFLLSNILQAVYNVADMLIVGNIIGDKGLSAINISGQVLMVISALIIGISVSGTVLVAQFKGANEMEKAKHTIGTMFTIFSIIGVAMTIISFALTPYLLKLINTPEEAFDGAVSYLRISSLGIIFIFGYNAVSSILRGLGDSKRPLYFIAFSTITNILLDLLFVGVFDMGVSGAAFATVIAQTCAFLLAIIYLKKSNFIFDFKLKSFKIHREYARLLFKIGLPSSIQMTLTSTSFLFMTSLINEYGLSVSAAAGIGGKIDSFAVLPALALSASVSSMVGQNIGAEKYDRVRKTMLAGMSYAILISMVIFTLTNVFSAPLIKAFVDNPNSPEAAGTIEAGIKYLRIATWAYLPLSIMFIINGLANGSGNTLFSLINTICTVLILRIPLAYLLSGPLGIGLDGVYIGLAASPLGGTFAGAIFYFRGRWKKGRLSVKLASADA